MQRASGQQKEVVRRYDEAVQKVRRLELQDWECSTSEYLEWSRSRVENSPFLDCVRRVNKISSTQLFSEFFFSSNSTTVTQHDQVVQPCERTSICMSKTSFSSCSLHVVPVYPLRPATLTCSGARMMTRACNVTMGTRSQCQQGATSKLNSKYDNSCAMKQLPAEIRSVPHPLQRVQERTRSPFKYRIYSQWGSTNVNPITARHIAQRLYALIRTSR